MDAVVAVTDACTVFVLLVCMLKRECESARVTAMLVWGMEVRLW